MMGGRGGARGACVLWREAVEKQGRCRSDRAENRRQRAALGAGEGCLIFRPPAVDQPPAVLNPRPRWSEGGGSEASVALLE